MADYWVSQNRKYCDFCKCWITDNKPSVDFHEKGRRHQANVKKKLRNISKQNSQAKRSSEYTDATLKQIEVAAHKAYKKDMTYNPDLTSIAMNLKSQGKCKVKKLWNEGKSRDGKSYYVNIMTKETVWEPPVEGFLSLSEQRQQADVETLRQMKEVDNFKKREGMLNLQRIQEEEAEAAARRAREKMIERRVVDETPLVTYGPLLEPGKTEPYGRWQTVKETVYVDLQLPATEMYDDTPPVEYEPEPQVKEFKEKTVETLGESPGETSFKKRKLNNVQRSTRQFTSDD